MRTMIRYIKAYIAALLFAVSGAALSAWNYWESPDLSPYLKAISPPACDFTITTTNSGWSQINNAAYRSFCVAPGDYTGVAIPVITADGTAVAPKYLYLYEAGAANTAHPYTLPAASRAVLSNLKLNGANYWVIYRLSFDLTSQTSANNPILSTNSDYNIWASLDIYNAQRGITLYSGSDYNTIQNCTVHNSKTAWDGAGLEITSSDGTCTPRPPSTNNVLVSNEIWDFNDSVQAIGMSTCGNRAVEEDYSGTVIINNDLYLTSAVYRNCETGAFDPTGQCHYEENAIDIKSGAENSASPFLFAHNRIWGWRADTTLYVAPISPTKSPGGSAVIHFYTKNTHIKGNIWFDTTTHMVTSGRNDALVISGNLFGPTVPVSWGNTVRSLTLLFDDGSTSVDVSSNVLTTQLGASQTGIRFTKKVDGVVSIGTLATVSFTNNALVDIRALDPATGVFGGTAFGNTYYAASDTKPTWDTASTYVGASVASVYDNQFCTTIKRITNPTTVCLGMALKDDRVPGRRRD